jgi:hypothetical protein
MTNRGGRKLHQIIWNEFRARRRKLGGKKPLTELRCVGIPSNGAAPPAIITSRIEGGDFNSDEIRFKSEPSVTVSARLHLPKSAGRKPVLVVFEEKRLPVSLYVQRSQSTTAIAGGTRAIRTNCYGDRSVPSHEGLNDHRLKAGRIRYD